MLQKKLELICHSKFQFLKQDLKTQLDELNQIDKNVTYEPEIALFAPKDNPLHFYERILEFASKNLSKNGVIYLEINPNFISEFNHLLTNYTVNHINFKDDFRGKKRLVRLTF